MINNRMNEESIITIESAWRVIFSRTYESEQKFLEAPLSTRCLQFFVSNGGCLNDLANRHTHF